MQSKAVAGLLIASCTITACEQNIDPEKAQQVMAQYAVMDTHKAIVLDADTKQIFATDSLPSPDFALQLAIDKCKGVPRLLMPPPPAVWPMAIGTPVAVLEAETQRQKAAQKAWETESAAVEARAQSLAKRPSANCIPMAVDDTQLYNPVPGAVAAQQRREADTAAANANAAAMLPAMLQGLQGLKH